MCLVDTVDSLAEGYTPCQIASAKAACPAMSMMESPSTNTFCYMICNNLVNNCPVTLESIWVADNVFGPDVASLQGKMVRRKPDKFDPAFVDVPPEILACNLDVVVVVDLMFVNGLPFLVLILQNITIVTVLYMPLRTADNLCKGMLQVVAVYQWRGLTVTTAMVDNQFHPLQGMIGDVDLNITAATEHALEIECCIQPMKEHIRTQKSHMPFSWLLAQMVIGLV